VVRLGCAFRELEARSDHVVDVTKCDRVSLRPIGVREVRGRPCRRAAVDLVAPKACPTDGCEHGDFVHAPPNGWLPKYRLEKPACRRGRHDLVAHALDLHLRSREAGHGSTRTYLKRATVIHE